MKFHLALFSLTLSDLERSIQVTYFQWPISPNLFKITTELLLMMGRKSFMRVHLAPLSLTLKGQSRSHRFSMAYISKSIQDSHKVTIDDG